MGAGQFLKGGLWPALVAGVMAGLMAGLVALPVAAGPLIIRATGPSAALFRPGQRLGDAPVMLKAGDAVVVFDRGGTRRFVGPGPLDVKKPSPKAEDSVDGGSLLPDGTRRTVIAAVRNLRDTVPVPPEELLADPALWAIRPDTQGNHCLLPDKPVPVLRNSAAAPQQWVIIAEDQQRLTLDFAAGQVMQTAPAAFFYDEDVYRLASDGHEQSITILLLPVLPPAEPLAALENLAEVLAVSGCEAQFAWLSRRLETY